MNTGKQPGKKSPSLPDSQTVVIRLQRDEVEVADTYSAKESRSRASFVRLMYLRGVKEFEREHGIDRRKA